MNWLRQAFIDMGVRVRALFGRRAMRARAEEEMRLHVEMREDSLVGAGLTPAEAKRRARRGVWENAGLQEAVGGGGEDGPPGRPLPGLSLRIGPPGGNPRV